MPFLCIFYFFLYFSSFRDVWDVGDKGPHFSGVAALRKITNRGSHVGYRYKKPNNCNEAVPEVKGA